MKKISSLSIFFPCLNDGNTLPTLVAKALEVGKRVSSDVEVIIIENGSNKETIEALNKLQRRYRDLRIVWFKSSLGYGGAIRQGFAHTTKEWVFYTDGDGQYDPLELAKLVAKLKPGITVVNGFKTSRSDSFIRKTLGNAYNSLLHFFFRLPIRDVDCDFRLIRRSLLEKISLKSTSGAICFELILKLDKAGARFAEVGVSHYSRSFGMSEFFRVPHILSTIKEYWHMHLPT